MKYDLTTILTLQALLYITSTTLGDIWTTLLLIGFCIILTNDILNTEESTNNYKEEGEGYINKDIFNK